MKLYHPISIFVTLQQILRPTTAHPSPMTAASPQATDALTTKTTTFTTSSTTTYWEPLTPLGPNFPFRWVLTQFVTQTSSRGVFPTYPATVLDFGRTTEYASETYTPSTGPVITQSVYTSTYISTTTFVVHKPQATDMPAGVRLADVPCGPCSNATTSYRTAPECDALQLDTACQGQCSMEMGHWWCRKLRGLEIVINPEYQMGRVCWGNGSLYHQLMTPCVEGDHQFECLSCTGGYYGGYNPTNWI